MPNRHYVPTAALLLAASAIATAPSAALARPPYAQRTSALARPPAGAAASPAVSDASPVRLALEDGRLGLYAASEFRLADGHCSDCPTPRQALWYFRDEPIAVPRAPGTSLPALVWLGAPERIESATLSSDGRSLRADNGDSFAMRLAPKIASNRSWFNDSTLDFFRQRAVSLRGTLDGNTFTARTIWPRDYTITPSTAQFSPLRSPDELQAWVRADHGGARSQFAARLIWKRPCVQTAWSNKPVLAVMLNGAQGDDDEAHGGHFAIATGKLGPQGEWSDWLVNNFYNLDNVSEKGIIASMTPMDAYLMDLNSGQSYYRPSWLLVAVLRSERTAAAYQQGIQRTFEHFYRHAFTYQHAAANCAGISVDMLRSLGWHIPPQGPTGRMQAIGAYAYMAASDASLQSGRKAYDYFSEEQTRLYPAVAFDAIGRDLLAVLGGQSGRTLSAFERQLHEDVEAVLLLRVPQVPSSRASGSAPVYSIAEYRARTPQDRSKWQIVPTEPRPFPAELREGVSISRAAGQPVPLPVAMLLVVVIGAAGAGAIWRRPVSAAQGRAALAPRAESRSKDQESQTGS